MADKAEEMEREIAEKNRMLDVLSKAPRKNGEEINKIRFELDRLLYRYYKQIISKYGSKLTVCSVW